MSVWPKKKSEKIAEKSKDDRKPNPTKGDIVFARIRRIEARLAHCESVLQTVRRDLNRVDKYVYRKTDSEAIHSGNHNTQIDPGDLAQKVRILGGLK